uniref:RNA binding motif protein 26 [Ochotona princeps] n=1 Tax=Lepeophtheirus salmonis TaxID=72036 RepID=A0A0K2UTN6_LEPSM
MLIENPESLKAWLTSVIEPLCDADPSALAKYVIALIKKDKAVSELRESMQEQMDVFLQGETKNFTRQLFEALDSKSYLSAAVSQAQTPLEEEELPKPTDAVKVEEEEPPQPPHQPPRPVVKRAEDERHRRRRCSPFRSTNSRRRRFRSRSPSYSSSKRRRSPYNGRRSRSPRRSRDSVSPPKEEEENGYTPSTKKRPPRCRDYDEKGFCMRGDMCKFDHGTDAVVLEDSSTPNPTSVPPPPYLPVSAPTAPYTTPDPYVPVSTVVPPTSGALVLPPLHVPPPGYAVPHTTHSSDPSRKRSFEGSNSDGYPPHKRFDFNRLGNRGGRGGPRGSSNGRNMTSKLAVRNIPPLYNNIAQLNNHFARFGVLVNVQVQFEGDPGSALVTFSKPTEAESAFSSSEAVMGNRFIKMFYHYDRPNFNSSLLSVKDRLGVDKNKTSEHSGDGSLDNGKPKDENGSSISQKAEEKAAEIAAIQKNQELLKANAELKKKQEDKKKEAVKNLSDLQRSKQSLLEKLIAQQKALIVKFEKSENQDEKTEIMKLSKVLTFQIENAREDVKKAMQASQVKKTPGELQKELLDAELELFNKQQNGNDTTELQKRVNTLKIEAARCGVLPTSRLPRGRAGYFRGGRGYRVSPYGLSSYRGGRGGITRGRGRGYGLTSVDRRPSKILVSGFEVDDKEEVITHFQKFGEIVDTIEDDSTPSFVFQFKLRRDAENAMNNGGKSCGDRVLQLSWYNNSNSEEFTSECDDKNVHETVLDEDDYTPLDHAYIPPGLEENDKSQSSDKDEKELNVDDLLYDGPEDEEEEEEEEEEERSWKRDHHRHQH